MSAKPPSQMQSDITIIKGMVEELRDDLRGTGNMRGYFERVRIAEDELERLRAEHATFLKEAPNRLKEVEKWLQEQQDFKRDISRKMWGGMIGGVFSVLVALFMAWQAS